MHLLRTVAALFFQKSGGPKSSMELKHPHKSGGRKVFINLSEMIAENRILDGGRQ
jgi:hypothetical protein